jgi:GDP-L-fucose synthase
LPTPTFYPSCPQPMREEYFLSDPLAETNRAYNRLHGTCFQAVMPTNLYGPNENYDLEVSHVLPVLIRKMHTAKITESAEVVQGTGQPRIPLWQGIADFLSQQT